MSHAVVRGEPTAAQRWLDARLHAAAAAAGGRGDGNVAQVMLHCMKQHPDKLALINGSTEARLTYGEVLGRVSQLARAVLAAGSDSVGSVGAGSVGAGSGDAGSGDAGSGSSGSGLRTLVVMRNTEHIAVTLYALLAAAAPPIMVDFNSTPKEVQYFMELQEPELVFCDSWTRAAALAAAAHYQKPVKIVEYQTEGNTAGAGTVAVEDFVQGYSDDWTTFYAATVAAESAALVMPTSGSTGWPKGACITHAGLVAHLPTFWTFESEFPSLALLVSSPQWLTHTLILTAMPLRGVAVLVSPAENTAQHLEQLFVRHAPQWMLLSPPAAARLAAVPAAALASLRRLHVTGSPPPRHVLDEIKSKLAGAEVAADGYGMTEAHGFVALRPPGAPPGCIGTVLNIFHYRIVDENGEQVAPNQVGELQIKSDYCVIKEYYRNPAALAGTVLAGGWLATGDSVRDDAGFLYYVARRKFGFKYLNYQVSPEEVEAVVSAVAGVSTACVCLAPAGPAALVLRHAPGAGGEEALRDHIHRAVNEALSDSKRLHGGVWFVDSLPLTKSGKVLRRESQLVLDRLLAEHGPQGQRAK